MAKRLTPEEKERRIAERTERFNAILDQELQELKDCGETEYRFMAGLDCNTCEICGRLDGVHFRIDEVRRGVNFPCMHLGCRCTITCVIPPKYRKEGETRSARAEDGSWTKVPASMTWTEWNRSRKTEDRGI